MVNEKINKSLPVHAHVAPLEQVGFTSTTDFERPGNPFDVHLETLALLNHLGENQI